MSNIIRLFGFFPNKHPIFYLILQKSPAGRAIFGKNCTITVQKSPSHTVSSSTLGDFNIDDRDFEVGGKNKGLKQIAKSSDGFVVKDDIERGYLKVIPLWHFGLMY
jgi:hypothetical protein